MLFLGLVREVYLQPWREKPAILGPGERSVYSAMVIREACYFGTWCEKCIFSLGERSLLFWVLLRKV